MAISTFLFTTFPLLLVAAAILLDGEPQPSASTIPTMFPGYTIDIMGFTGSIGGYDVKLNGSVQEIYSQMAITYPDFKSKMAALSTTRLQTRSAENKNGLICYPVPGQNWEPAPVPAIEDGIHGLESISGCCSVRARSCVRIACEYDSAIWLCNDNNYAICPSCIYLASYAQDIVNRCQFPSPPYDECGGQEFDSDRYNIIVRDDSC